LKKVVPELKQLSEVSLKALEKKLEEKGAPYTPGRGVGNDE
jgi:hypothetical protein